MCELPGIDFVVGALPREGVVVEASYNRVLAATSSVLYCYIHTYDTLLCHIVALLYTSHSSASAGS